MSITLKKNNSTQDFLEDLVKTLNVEKTFDFIQFKTTFMNHFDFERVRELCQTNQIKRTGSRTISWKLMLGMLPVDSNKEKWVQKINESRQKYDELRNKHFSIFSQIKSSNPLSLLSKDTSSSLLNCKQDQEIRNLINKDVERTLQEVEFFKNKKIQQYMEEMLFIWAKEHPEYKYQQGLNEILAIVMIALASELSFSNLSQNLKKETAGAQAQESVQEKEEDEDEDLNDLYSIAHNPSKLYRILHDKEFFVADTYILFERILDLGIKELYYKEDIQLTETKVEELNTKNVIEDPLSSLRKRASSTKDESSTTSEGSQISQAREKKIKLLNMRKEELQKTSLTKRSNKIHNNFLKEIDAELFNHLQDLQIQPELIFLKQLRCLLCREFKLNEVLLMWDYIFSGIEEDGRFLLDSKQKNTVQEEGNFSNLQDSLINLDYCCLAMIQYQRQTLLSSDYMDCLKTMVNYPKLDCANEIIKIAERIKKIIEFKLNLHQKKVLPQDNFPQLIERQTYQFTCINEDHNDSQDEDLPTDKKTFFQVKEVEQEDEEEEEEEKVQKEKQIDNLSQEADENDNSDQEEALSELEDQFESHNDEEDGQKTNKQQFKLKNAKGNLIFDQQTKQKRYLSPFEQFLAEQDNLFQKNVEEDQRMMDEQNSVTVTTTASTQFDQKLGVFTVRAASEMGVEDNTSQKKVEVSSGSKQGTSSKLQQVAKIIEIDTKIKTAEDKILEERKKHIEQLRFIRNYLGDMKTGVRIKKEQYRRNFSTKVESKGFF